MKKGLVFASGVALGVVGYIGLTNKPSDKKRIVSGDSKLVEFIYNGTSRDFPKKPFHCIVADNVTSIGSYAFYYCSSLKKITIPSSVTSIGNYAFANCTSLETIMIPNSVTSVGSGAFLNCRRLTTITIPSSSHMTSIGNRAFKKCKSLTSITIPITVTNIGDYAFSGCMSLIPFDIPNVTHVGKDIFNRCKQTNEPKKKVQEKNAMVNWIQSHITKPLNKKQELPYYVTSSSNNSVKNITFIVGENPNIYLPKFPKTPFNLTLLGKYGKVKGNFRNNKYIQSIKIPNTFSIHSFAFHNCVNLKDVYIGKNMEKIYDTAFNGCPNVYFHVSDENTKFASLNGVLFSKDYTKLIKGVPLLFNKTSNEFIGKNDRVPNQPNKFLWDHITSFGSFMAPGIVSNRNHEYGEIEFPPNLRRIEESALDLCYINGILKTPKYLNKISSYLFKNLSNNNSFGKKTEIIISKSVNIISETAFDSFYGKVEVEKENKHFSSENNAIFNKDKSTLLRYISPQMGFNKNIAKFTVPYGVVNIGNYAFYNSLVEEISIPETVRNIGVGVFNGCKNLKIINFSPTIKLRKFGTFNFYNCYINRCIEIISSPTYRHWSNNNFGNIFLYAGNTIITDYVEGVGLMPETKVIRNAEKNAEKVVKNICKTNKIDIIENNILYNDAINKYKNAVKKLNISGEKDDEDVERKATIAAITYLAVNSALNNLNEIDINKNYYDKTDEAFKQANNAIINLEPSNMYKEAYITAFQAAYNVYSTAKPIVLNKSEDLDESEDLNEIKDLDESEVSGVDKNDSNTTENMKIQRIRIRLKPANRCIITNSKDWPLTNKTNNEILDEACNSIVTIAKETGATVKGPIRLPNKVLLKNFYANYHIEKKVKGSHGLIMMYGSGANATGDAYHYLYVIEPTKETIDLLNNFRGHIKVIFTKYNNNNNNNKCEYIKIYISGDNFQLSTKKIIKIVNQNGAVAMYGPLGYFNKDRGIGLLNSKYVDETTREIVKNEIFINRLIDICNPTAKTIDHLMNLELPNKVDVEFKA